MLYQTKQSCTRSSTLEHRIQWTDSCPFVPLLGRLWPPRHAYAVTGLLFTTALRMLTK